MEYLKQLPIRVVKAKIVGQPSKYVEVLVDGDYDGEWFASLPWRVHTTGYVMLGANGAELISQVIPERYLHHLVLPKRKGYIRTHLNGNRLDNRSCNIGYMTMKDRMKIRETEKRQEDLKAFRYRMDNPRKDNMDDNEGTPDHPDVTEPRS